MNFKLALLLTITSVIAASPPALAAGLTPAQCRASPTCNPGIARVSPLPNINFNSPKGPAAKAPAAPTVNRRQYRTNTATRPALPPTVNHRQYRTGFDTRPALPRADSPEMQRYIDEGGGRSVRYPQGDIDAPVRGSILPDTLNQLDPYTRVQRTGDKTDIQWWNNLPADQQQEFLDNYMEMHGTTPHFTEPDIHVPTEKWVPGGPPGIGTGPWKYDGTTTTDLSPEVTGENAAQNALHDLSREMIPFPPKTAAAEFKKLLGPLDRPLSDAVRVEDLPPGSIMPSINLTPPKDLSTATLGDEKRPVISENYKAILDASWEDYFEANIDPDKWKKLAPAQQQEIEYSYKYNLLKALWYENREGDFQIRVPNQTTSVRG